MNGNQYAVNSKVWWNGQQWTVKAVDGLHRVLALGDETRKLSTYSLDRVPANNGGQYTITEPRR